MSIKTRQPIRLRAGWAVLSNLRTQRPSAVRFTEAADRPSGNYNYADLLKKGFFSGNALYSNQWDTGIGRIGGLVSASIGNIGNRTDSVQLGRFVPETLGTAESGLPAGSTDHYIPNAQWGGGGSTGSAGAQTAVARRFAMGAVGRVAGHAPGVSGQGESP